MRRLLLLLGAAALLVLVVYTATARASNWPEPRLDAIATQIAGHPVSVYCEMDWRPWIYNGEYGAAGFTYLEYTTVFIAPDWCEALHYLVAGEDVGSIYAAEAILVLTHESMHQRNRLVPALGRNEAFTECLALKEFRSVAVSLFGIPETVQQQSFKLVTRLLKRRVRGKTVTFKVSQTVPIVVTLPNPYLQRVLFDMARWDAALPAAYHGATC